MNPLLASDAIVALVLAGGLALALIGVLSSFVTGIVRERARSRTQREIAAYVAEGSITAEEGERLMRAAGAKPGKD